jgi:hypothetical protein
LVQADVAIGDRLPQEVATWRRPKVSILNDHFEAASVAWQAYRQPTPQDWFDLLGKDLRVLPQLRHSVQELLEKLPMDATGLSATQMRMLEPPISAGNAGPFDVFPGDKKRNGLRVFGYWEAGALLEGLAHYPQRAVSGLDEGPLKAAFFTDDSLRAVPTKQAPAHRARRGCSGAGRGF